MENEKRNCISFTGTVYGAVFTGSLALAEETETTAFADESSPAETSVFEGGSGTAEDPWQIATVEQLQAVHDDLTASYVLTADIDLDGVDFEPIGNFEAVSEEDSETPKEEAAFTGSFDGDGYTISNLVMEDDAALSYGLFGCIYGENAVVTDLKVEDISLTGSMMVGVIGYAASENPVDGITLEGDNQISGLSMVGGIVGGGFYVSAYAEFFPEPEAFSVTNCEASGTINGGEMAGSVAGYVYNNSTVEGCAAEEPQIGADAETVGLEQLK